MDDQRPGHIGDASLEAIVIFGFIVIVGGLGFFVVPKENEAHFSQALGAYIVIVTLVAKSLWERRGQTAEVTSKALGNAGALQPPAVENAVARGTEAGVENAVGGAIDDLNTEFTRMRDPKIVAAPSSYVGPELPDVASANLATPEEPTWAR